MTALDLPRAHGGPWISAHLKSTPEDFHVSEVLGFEPDGHGEHVLALIRKRDLNTQDVVERLQRMLKISPVDIGVSGLKDRRAIAEQWISVRGVDEVMLSRALQQLFDDREVAAQTPGGCADRPLTLLRCERHRRKLRRGTHRSNRFCILLRDVRFLAGGPGAVAAGRSAFDLWAPRLSDAGFPNYFGPQRFGIDGRNLIAAESYLAAGGRQRLSRQRRSLLLSAARSALFNRVCAARVADGTWLDPQPGEPLLLDGTQSFFVPAVAGGRVDPASVERCHQGDVHTSGPLWGAGEPIADGACLGLENDVLGAHTAMCRGLEMAGLQTHRRALRCQARQWRHDWLADDVLRIEVELPKGVFATSMLAEVMVESSCHRPSASADRAATDRATTVQGRGHA